MSDKVIRFEGVHKSFGGVAAVDGISFAADAGETVALLGPSGCGKTTTLRLIAGFEAPDRGAIEIAGESMIGRRPYERNVGLLFQHYALFPHMSVAENIAYGLKHRDWPRDQIAGRVEEMLRLVQLSGFGDRRPRQLSGGQQQRVALARVLATRPKLVLLDEPLSALDAKLREELGSELKEILTSVGSTTIVVTHDQDEAMMLADRIIVMNRGRIDQEGSPDDVYRHPANHFVATFIGRSNWFEGTTRPPARAGQVSVVLKSGQMLSASGGETRSGAVVRVGVRPERIELTAAGQPSASPENSFDGTIAEVRSMGAERHYHVDCAAGTLMVVKPSSEAVRFARHDKVVAAFGAADCMVFAQGGASVRH